VAVAKIVLGMLVILLIVAAVVIYRLARRIERARTALDAKKAAYQQSLREGGGDAEIEFVVTEIDRTLANGSDDDGDDDARARRAERLQELKTVLLRSRAARPTPFDAAGACADVVEAWRRQVPDEEITFEPPAAGKAEVVGDPDLFRWALREMFSNVVAHGGAWDRIAVELGSEDGVALLSFSDDGEGPDLTTTSRLYGAFTPRRESGGPGLGLYAIRAIVERMGGSIEASPGDDGGLRHRLRLPLKRSAPTVEPETKAASRA
jgi:signal transduction histidine kinase